MNDDEDRSIKKNYLYVGSVKQSHKFMLNQFNLKKDKGGHREPTECIAIYSNGDGLGWKEISHFHFHFHFIVSHPPLSLELYPFYLSIYPLIYSKQIIFGYHPPPQQQQQQQQQ
ncbi:hypothetical protein DFA_05630 [Cavenderia fasciculata]|uniref:Uncharacterized protein n=1 Tax=Cavenderia fasciculata TaxID=261658 RepID=F4PLS5_CACFS|nr:uncharacterized protein DFA_05630 [Cavenderia fasciculata]EGG23497.1 hypothetical protein DFA_05630 [Cavenderia fasciculata]|eukprot:XP_004361348.1 hypothetical protein DFA_05630 [Cavenderia fasciculata]